MLLLDDPGQDGAFSRARRPLDALTGVLFAQFGLIVGAISLALLAVARSLWIMSPSLYSATTLDGCVATGPATFMAKSRSRTGGSLLADAGQTTTPRVRAPLGGPCDRVGKYVIVDSRDVPLNSSVGKRRNVGSRELLCQPSSNRIGAAIAMCPQDINDIAPGNEHERMPISTDLFVRLVVVVGGSNEYAEHAMPHTRDQPREFSHPYRVSMDVALGLQHELDGHAVREWSKHVVTYGIAASVTARLCQFHSPRICGGHPP